MNFVKINAAFAEAIHLKRDKGRRETDYKYELHLGRV